MYNDPRSSPGLAHIAQAQIQEELLKQALLLSCQIAPRFRLEDAEQIDHLLGGRKVFLPLLRHRIWDVAKMHKGLGSQGDEKGWKVHPFSRGGMRLARSWRRLGWLFSRGSGCLRAFARAILGFASGRKSPVTDGEGSFALFFVHLWLLLSILRISNLPGSLPPGARIP